MIEGENISVRNSIIKGVKIFIYKKFFLNCVDKYDEGAIDNTPRGR